MLVPTAVEAAPRWSPAWCEQMMNKPAGQWSINDHNAFDDNCKKQRAEMARRVSTTEDTSAFESKLFSGGGTPAAKHTASGPQTTNAGGPTTSSQAPTDPAAAGVAYRAAQRAKFQKYLDEHGGSTVPTQTPQTQ